MSKTLEQAVSRIQKLSIEQQEEAAAILNDIAEQDPDAVQLTDEQAEEVKRLIADPNPQYATHEEVKAVFSKLLGT